MTSLTDGTIASEPETGRLSKSDMAKARVAVHANMALHRLTQAVSARPCRTKGTSWARAFARAVRNCAVSALHLPPTSAARTKRRALPPSQESSGWGASFLRLQRRAIEVGCPGSGGPIPAYHHCCVYGDLSSPPECQPVRHHFQPAAGQL